LHTGSRAPPEHAAMPIALALSLVLTFPAPQATTRASVRSDGLGAESHSATAGISPDGRFVGFVSLADDLDGPANGQQDAFVHDRFSGATALVSIGHGGAAADGASYSPLFSADGRFVAFRSEASNLVPGDGNGASDVFVRDLATGTTERISLDASGGDPDAWSYYQTISADGRYVCFQSEASDLVAGDVNATFDVFVRDRLAGVTEIASVGSGGAKTGFFQFNVEPAISADGNCVVFTSVDEELAPGAQNGVSDVFLRDRAAGTTELVSLGLGGVPGNGASSLPSPSADGRFVAFVSEATNLVAGDTNGVRDVFVRDRWLGVTELVSVASDGTRGSLDSYLYYSHPTISADGRFVVFESYAPELVPGDANGWSDAFLRDRVAGTTELVSVTSAGAQVHFGALRATLSADGSAIAFESGDDHLVAGDVNAAFDVFVREPHSPCAPVTAVCTAKPNSLGCTPVVGASGLPSAAGFDAFHFTATGVRSHEPGLLLVSGAAAGLPFGGGTLCVAPPALRTGFQLAAGTPGVVDCSGTYAVHLTQAWLAAHAFAPGTSLWAQWLSRDTGFAPPHDVGLSDALSFAVCP
jgi:Tol biopolymer transport system component